MEGDSSEAIPKGDTATEAEFARLLCDKTFVDYFNTFLSLPVFSQRLLYRFIEQTFELDPPIKRTKYRLDRLKLMRWVRTKRAPLFFKTDLFLEYLLCKQLQKTQLHISCRSDQTSAKDRMLDRRLMSRWLSRVSGMRKFRCFLEQTAGKKALFFWLDAERFRKTTNCPDEHRVLFRQMETKYFIHGGNMELPEHAKWLASTKPVNLDAQDDQPNGRVGHQPSHFIGSGVELESCLPGGSLYGESQRWLIAPDAFVIIQGFFLKTLQNYWVPRYLIHCKAKWMHLIPPTPKENLVYRPDSYAVQVRSLSDLVDEDADETNVSSKAVRVMTTCRLKSKGAFNLLSMFSSPGVRRSELAAIMKLEDTGETLGGGKPDTTEEVVTTTDRWTTEDFPLPTISEESIVSEMSLKLSTQSLESTVPSAQSPVANPPDSPKPDDTLPASAEPESTTPEPTNKSPVEEPAGTIQESTQEQSPDLGDKVKESRETRVTPPPSRLRQSSDNTGLSSLDTDKLSRFQSRMRRNSFAVPYQISRDSSSSSVGRSSVSGDSIHTPSLRRMSLSSGTALEPSSGSIASSRGPTGSKKPVHKPPRRSRAMSMEFRLADFSMMIKSLDSGGASGGSENKDKLDKIASIGMPQLEADMAALTAQNEKEERRKAEKANKKHKRRGSNVEEDLGKKGKESFSGKERRGRRGSGAFKPLGRHQAQLTRGNLAMLEAMHRGKKKSTGLLSRRETYQSGKMGTGSELGKYGGLQKEEIEELVGPVKEYSSLTFQEKLDYDTRRLSRLPSISPDHKRSLDTSKHGQEGQLADPTFAIGTRLPDIHTEMCIQHIGALGISQPSYRGYGLGDDNYRQKNALLTGAISSDKLAGCPLYAFLQRRNLNTELCYLQFWQAAQEYLETGTCSSDVEGSFSRHRLARQLKATYLTQSGDRHISLGDRLVEELCDQLPQDTADELVVHAQNLACEALGNAWKDFQRFDLEEFLSKTTSKKNFQLDAYTRPKHRSGSGFPEQSPQKGSSTDSLSLPSVETSSHAINQLVKTAREGRDRDSTSNRNEIDERSVNIVAPHRMWRALQLAVSASRSVSEPVVISDPSDPDSDSEDEGSLRRKLTTVYRKRKPKPVKDVGPVLFLGPSTTRRELPGNHPQRSLDSKQSKHKKHSKHSRPEADEEEDSPWKTVCRAIRKDGKTIQRPPRPKTFQDVLRDASHHEFFKRFLVQKHAEIQFQFWQAVDNIKATSRDAKSRQSKTILTVRKFFCKATDFGAALQCNAEIIEDIPTLEKVTPQMLMSAQACIARTMEERWFELYRDTFPDEASDEELVESSLDREQTLAPREKNKALWAMFISNVTSFRRGLMNKATLTAFKTFFAKEMQRELEKQKQTGIQVKKIISNKVIVVERLPNDLSFWAEVERFKELADSAARAAASGTYTIDDEEYVQKKAKAIIDCYIDSQVPPKLQVNISQEIADEILETANNGLIERGIFHDAALSIFSVLLYCWKKFCRERFAPPSKKSSITSLSTEPVRKGRKKKRRGPSTPLLAGVKIKTITGTAVDDPPKMQFTLQTGLQLILPPKPRSDDRERICAFMRQLYPSNDGGHDDGRHGDEKILHIYQAAQQLQLRRRLSRSLGQHLAGQLARQFNQ